MTGKAGLLSKLCKLRYFQILYRRATLPHSARRKRLLPAAGRRAAEAAH